MACGLLCTGPVLTLRTQMDQTQSLPSGGPQRWERQRLRLTWGARGAWREGCAGPDQQGQQQLPGRCPESRLWASPKQMRQIRAEKRKPLSLE